MIKAGKFTIEDNGFAVSIEVIGGVTRQALTAELPAGISDEALEAVCAGPIEVLDRDGSVVQTHTGPFRILSHGLKLTRANATDDVAVLAARVSSLEAELSEERSAKTSAVDELASLSEQLQTLKGGTDSTSKPEPVAGESVVRDEQAGV